MFFRYGNFIEIKFHKHGKVAVRHFTVKRLIDKSFLIYLKSHCEKIVVYYYK